MPKVDRLAIHEDLLREQLLPRLMGSVFHVTTEDRFQGIVDSGAVLANADGSLGDTFPQSAISLARKKGFTCLFDLRSPTDQDIEWGLQCFYFLAPRRDSHAFAFLFLGTEGLAKLLAPRDVTPPGEYAGFHVPRIEVFFPGDLPVSLVDRVLLVDVERRPVDPHGLEHLLAMSRDPSRPFPPGPVSRDAQRLIDLLSRGPSEDEENT